MTGSDMIVIAGPTASGKSALALALAEALGGVVINADSMQIYRELAILTARPGPAELVRAPHRLYGVLSGAERCSAARWRGLALEEIAAARARGTVPIVVGGTGLYLRALTEGLAEIPDIPPAIRLATLARHRMLGGMAFRDELRLRDPQAAARLHAGDTQRLIRAWEVFEATGRSILDWQSAPARAPGIGFHAVLLMPRREVLYAACNRRFAAMMGEGALDEVRRLDSLELDPSLPIMKAIGVPELRDYLKGELPLADAVARGQQATRRYAKRQMTWFRHQWPGRAGPRTTLTIEAGPTEAQLSRVLAVLQGVTL